jgi:hypothetical protein
MQSQGFHGRLGSACLLQHYPPADNAAVLRGTLPSLAKSRSRRADHNDRYSAAMTLLRLRSFYRASMPFSVDISEM